MSQIIIIAGAPGAGKSTLAQALQERTQTPMFEFGWIPEYRYRTNGEISYDDEEQISFENLVLVTRNYIQHGFRGVILTDLNDRFLEDIETAFNGLDYRIVTLVVRDESVLRQRVLDPSRSSGFRNVVEALAINQRILSRQPYLNETRIDVTGKDVLTTLDETLAVITTGSGTDETV